jgi:hypothetical protein
MKNIERTPFGIVDYTQFEKMNLEKINAYLEETIDDKDTEQETIYTDFKNNLNQIKGLYKKKRKRVPNTNFNNTEIPDFRLKAN